MFDNLPRRKRQIAWTLVLSVFFLAVAAVALWSRSTPSETYKPGERVAGLTASLDRKLPEDYPRVTFTDVTRAAGISFRHFDGERSSRLPEDMGSGAAWGDYDGDGDLDLYVVNVAGPLTRSPEELAASPAHNALYRNDGDGAFTDVSAEAGVDLRGWGMAAAWGDYDNDGRLDLFTTAYGENTLFHNDGDGTFTDVSARAGTGGVTGFWAGAAWADYDGDGYLDLYVTGYVRYDPRSRILTSRQYETETPASINPSSFAPERNLLYHNDGDGTFTETARAAGVENPEGRSLSAAWIDVDEDGRPDLYVANDVSDNVLFHNRGDGTFDDVSHLALVADYRGAMGIAAGDWDGDADTDLFVTHWIAQENALYNNLRANVAPTPGRPVQFMDVADRYGLGQIALDFVGWGTSFFDYDHDGRLDLFVVNGSTLQQPDDPRRLTPMKDQLFWNRGPKEGFFDVSSVSGAYFGTAHVGRGAALGDYDDDGDLDLFIVNHGGSGVLLRNDGGNERRWLKVRLEGRQSNRSAIGARVRLAAGGVVQVRQVGAQSSYLSQNDLTVHFGLGEAAVVDTLEVRWPSGLRQVLTGIPTNRTLHVVESEEAL